MSTLLRYVRALAPTLIAFVPSIGGGQRPSGRPLAIEDYYRVKTVGPPDISPDGKWVAYTVSTRVETTNGNTSEVWLAAFDGASQPRQAGTPGEDATGPSWLDDGRLRFSSAGRTIVVDPSAPDHPTESTATTSLAGGRAGGGGGRGGRGGGRGGSGIPMPSPDGKWVAVVRDMPPPKRERVYESDFAKRHEERFKGVEFDWMDFQRDAAPFPLPNRVDPDVNPPQEIFIAPAGGTERALTHLGLRPAGANWNHAGTMLAFSADSTYRNEMLYGRSDVWTVSTDGAVKTLTSSDEHSYAGAQFSPDGATHAGSFDNAYLGCLPNFVIMAASDEAELVHMVATQVAINDRPSAVRYPRGEGRGVEMPEAGIPLEIGKGRIVREGTKIALLSFGTRLAECEKAADELAAHGLSTTIADARFMKPLDVDMVLKLAREHEILLTIEEGSIGGFGSHVMQTLAEHGMLDGGLRMRAMVLPDEFLDHDSPNAMYARAGLDAKGIVAKVFETLGKDFKAETVKLA